jgi:hypothetical protein
MKVEVPRTELFSSIGRNRHLFGQHAVLVIEDLQCTRIFRLGRAAFVPAGHQDRQTIVGCHAHLMGEDARVDGTRLLYLFSGREVRVDAVDAHRARIVEGNQNIRGWNVRADMDRTRRQRYRCTVRRQRASRRINGKCGEVMRGSLRAVAGGAAAGRYIEIASRRMRPGILHGGRQCDRLTLRQLRGCDTYVVMREIGAHVCVERDLLGVRLGGSESRCGHAACDK